MPGLFPLLRSLVDRARRRGLRSGLYLLLGSLAPEVSRQAGESLAGRASYLELAPFDLLEVGREAEPVLWLRGGFPESFLALGDEESWSGRSLSWEGGFPRRGSAASSPCWPTFRGSS